MFAIFSPRSQQISPAGQTLKALQLPTHDVLDLQNKKCKAALL